MIIFLYIMLLLVSVLLIMVILVQRGRGGGLAGAFGSGGGSSSAFGTKTGDVFTTLTVVTFVVFILLSIALSFQYKYKSPPNPPGEVALVGDPEPTSVTLQWADNADNEKGYRIMRNDVALTPDLPPDRTKFVDSNLTPGTAYTYVVQVFNDAGKASSSPYTTKTAGETATKPARSTQPSTTTSGPEATRPAATGALIKQGAGTTTLSPSTIPTSMPILIPPATTAPATLPPASIPATTSKP